MARKATPRKKPARKAPLRAVEATRPSPFPIVGIGASAGGLEAFMQFLEALPKNSGMAFVLVPHLAPNHESMMSQILGRRSPVLVIQVKDGMTVERDTAYVIAPGVEMVIEGGRLRLSPRPAGGAKHTIDRFLASLASEMGHAAIGVVLSGTAHDGTAGLEEIKAAGGLTFAQDDSAHQKSMPQSAVEAGAVDFVLSPAEIAREIVRVGRHPLVVPGSAVDTAAMLHEAEFQQVLDLLRGSMDVDFSGYKRNTLLRRISRRIVVHKLPGLAEYVKLLQRSSVELDALFRDMLISVTSFFRNPEAFEAIRERVLPQLLNKRDRHSPLRVWVQGCSTGEEAYSIAMLLTEYTDEKGLRPNFQVFATDVNGVAIDRARAGLYPRAIVEDVTPERIRRFFVEADGAYRVSKAVREKCVFAQHNVLVAPPFSHIDLVSCRNLLIYLEAVAQQRLIPILHYALKPHGFLWLGQSETIGSFRDLFEVTDQRHKIYRRKPVPARAAIPLGGFPARRHAPGDARRPVVATASPSLEPHREADRFLLSRFAPAAVLVDSEFEVLQFRGDTGRFLTPAPGRASLNLIKLLREGLLVEVRGALLRARKTGRPVRVEGLRLMGDESDGRVSVEVMPMSQSHGTGTMLVMFEQASPRRVPPSVPIQVAKRPGDGSRKEAARLGRELTATREYLQSIIEQLEASNEELQSANEEVQSSNEELQSINEELETSKEEIQSVNEELATVNDELQHRNQELIQSNNDFMNLLTSVQMPIVMLGQDLRVRRFTPMAEKLLGLIPADIGRPITDIKLGLSLDDLEPMLHEVLESVSAREQEVQDRHGHWHLLRVRPYRTSENHFDGVVLLLVDIDALRSNQETMWRQNELLAHTWEPVIMFDLAAGTVLYWNRAAEDTYGYAASEALGRGIHELLEPGQDARQMRRELERSERWSGELRHRHKDGTDIEVEARVVLVRQSGGPAIAVEATRPIAERKAMENSLRDQAAQLQVADRSRNDFLALLAHELRTPLGALRNIAQVLRTPGASPDALDRARGMMNRQIQNMARMIDDLLDVARVAQGQIELHREPLDLRSVIERALEVSRAKFDERGQNLSVSLGEKPLDIEGDASRLEQVFVNLLSNASKFTQPGGRIWLSAELARRSSRGGPAAASQVVVRLRDEGVGIGQALLPHVFDLFAQAERSPERLEGGLGLGLTVVRRVVELHGGSVEASSAGLGMGSEFTVRLPLAPVMVGDEHEDPAPAEPRRRPRSTGPKRVLIVDDEPDGAETMALVLRQEGHDAKVAHSAESALEALSSFKPTVAIIDIALPGMDGFALAEAIAARPEMRKARLVGISGFSQTVLDPDGSKSKVFDQVLEKPVDLDILRDILQGG